MRKLKLTKKFLDQFNFCKDAEKYYNVIISDNQNYNFKLFHKLNARPGVVCWCGSTDCDFKYFRITNVYSFVNKLGANYVMPTMYDDWYFMAGLLADAVGVYLTRKKSKNV